MASDVLPHEKEVRVRVVEVNLHLQEEAARVRQRLGIPEGGFASPGHAIKWRLRHCEETRLALPPTRPISMLRGLPKAGTGYGNESSGRSTQRKPRCHFTPAPWILSTATPSPIGLSSQ